uniref:Reverse transcriptase domain-containing protein n=1 Tax=Tanacetum cinerariifolium TaxID=118510 RepID=A0A6L2KLZ8_TANCI|nr:reverse transcriptase domain-containing protein [Tanacetum cinerariifolium]
MVNVNSIVESIPPSLIPIQDNDSQREEIDIATNTDVLPPGLENDDLDGEIDAVEELHVDNSISNSKNELSDNEASDFDNPSFLRPPSIPPDAKFELDTGDEISVVMNDNDELECLNPRDEFDVSNDENDDYFPFMFVIRIFLPYLICSKMFLSFLSAESEDTIFDLEVPNTTIKLLLFPFSLEGEARTWLDKEPPHSILTWEDLVSKFIHQFFPPSKTTYLQNGIINFLQKTNETFNEAWERFKNLLRQCPHHGFSELHQLDTFYNALNLNDQDALDSAA